MCIRDSAYIEGDITAAGTVAVLHLQTGDPTQDLAHAARAAFLNLLAAQHATRTSMVEYVLLARLTQPVAHHLGAFELHTLGQGW